MLCPLPCPSIFSPSQHPHNTCPQAQLLPSLKCSLRGSFSDPHPLPCTSFLVQWLFQSSGRRRDIHSYTDHTLTLTLRSQLSSLTLPPVQILSQHIHLLFGPSELEPVPIFLSHSLSEKHLCCSPFPGLNPPHPLFVLSLSQRPCRHPPPAGPSPALTRGLPQEALPLLCYCSIPLSIYSCPSN